MNSSKIYYGEERVGVKELIECNEKSFIKLEYYGTRKVAKDKFIGYGVEIVKKEYRDNNLIKESKKISNITGNEGEMIELISILKRNKVTPIGLEDIIGDMLKERIAD